MIWTHQMGDIEVAGVVEYYGPVYDPARFPGYSRQKLEAHADWLAPRYWVPEMDMFVITFRLWVVKHGGKVILIDTGFGNHKKRSTPHANMLNTVTMPWLASVGATPDSVTHVVMTHLHNDHVGWNTSLRDGKWVPTFPKAKHFMPRRDFEFFDTELKIKPEGALTHAFADSVVPIVEAGLAEMIEPGDVVAGLLRAEDAPGHTPGMVTYWMDTADGPAVFCADIFHHPIQIWLPEWNSPPDILGDAARATRASFLKQAAATGALIFPSHFSPPGCGYIREKNGSYIFEEIASA